VLDEQVQIMLDDDDEVRVAYDARQSDVIDETDEIEVIHLHIVHELDDDERVCVIDEIEVMVVEVHKVQR
jgi:hypothetical protein